MRVFLGFLIVLCGCAPRGGGTSMPDQTVEQVRLGQSQRTSAFDVLVARGVIEFRWTDESGNHKEQGDLDFWKQGTSVSIRVSKLGEPLIWLGGGRDSYWFFDLLGDETTLTLGGDNSIFSDIQTSLILLGLEPLPEGEMTMNGGIVTVRDDLGRMWTATFEPVTNRPLEIRVDRGTGKASALHRKGILVEIDNKLALYWPVTGGLIDLEDSRDATRIKIAFSSISTIIDEEPMDRVFDVDFLERALKPSVIVDRSEN